MLCNKLKLNEDKTEIIVCNPRNFHFELEDILIGEESINPSNCAKNLGVFIGNKLSMTDHISHMSKAIYLELRRLKQASKYLNISSMKKLTSSFVLSRLDYCNSLFINLPTYQLQKLQKLQNYAARIIFNKTKKAHVTPLLKDLHWLLMQARIDTLIYKCLNGLAPPCMANLIEMYSPNRSLRSSSKDLLEQKMCNYKSIGERSFSFYAPVLWNSLPQGLRDQSSINSFKGHLKTHLFRSSYN